MYIHIASELEKPPIVARIDERCFVSIYISASLILVHHQPVLFSAPPLFIYIYILRAPLFLFFSLSLFLFCLSLVAGYALLFSHLSIISSLPSDEYLSLIYIHTHIYIYFVTNHRSRSNDRNHTISTIIILPPSLPRNHRQSHTQTQFSKKRDKLEEVPRSTCVRVCSEKMCMYFQACRANTCARFAIRISPHLRRSRSI